MVKRLDTIVGMPYGIIYCLTNKINGKRYVGQTTRLLEDRWKTHCVLSRSRTSKKFALHSAIQKYGSSEFIVECLQKCDDLQSLNASERKWISDLGTLSPAGYNLSTGGEREAGFKHAAEVKNKIAASLSGKKHTNARKEAISKSMSIRPVRQLSLVGEFICEFSSATKASKNLNVSRDGIIRCCKGVLKTSGKFKWEFVKVI